MSSEYTETYLTALLAAKEKLFSGAQVAQVVIRDQTTSYKLADIDALMGEIGRCRLALGHSTTRVYARNGGRGA